MSETKNGSFLWVILAFAAVYIIWGSTYFFIELAVKYLSPPVLGAVRFFASGVIMLIWGMLRGEKVWDRSALLPSIISGILMLFLGNGAVIWSEQYLHSSFVAIFMASAPLWFLLLDKFNWKENFSNRYTLLGVSIGLIGVIALFYEKVSLSSFGQGILPLVILCTANISWSIGSLYSKYRAKQVSQTMNAAWQMLAAGAAFAITGVVHNDFATVDWATIPLKAWMFILYLVVFGSIIGYSAYVYLLSVRSVTTVSTYAYVNPLVAVLLGVLINKDHLSVLQLSGLAIILCSVFFINLAKKRSAKVLAT